MERKRTFVLFAMLGVIGAGPACSLSPSNDDSCADPPYCYAHPSGPTHGLTSDGRVDTTAAEAWPNRPTLDPGPVSGDDVAKACAAYGACLSTFATPPVSSTDDETLALATSLCTIPDSTEERVVPMGSHDERWSWWIRAMSAEASSGSPLGVMCDAIGKLETDRPKDVYCEEDGCWSTSSSTPVVRCDGSVATISDGDATYVRDCSHAYAACDETSPTGCTDRAPTSCDPAGNDRCDGDMKLGCDRNGLVSFHDCSLIHAKCVESPTGASCVTTPDAGCDVSAQACDGTKLTLCTFGAKTTVDCAALGFSGCTRGHCTAD